MIKDLLFSFFSIIFGIWLYVYSGNYAIFKLDPIGGSGFPRILAIIIILCGLMVCIPHLKTLRNATTSGKKVILKKNKAGHTNIVILVSIFIILYIFLIDKLGYIFSSFLLVFAVLYIQKIENVKKILLM